MYLASFLAPYGRTFGFDNKDSEETPVKAAISLAKCGLASLSENDPKAKMSAEHKGRNRISSIRESNYY
jgi:hypothetical protein